MQISRVSFACLQTFAAAFLSKCGISSDSGKFAIESGSKEGCRKNKSSRGELAKEFVLMESVWIKRRLRWGRGDRKQVQRSTVCKHVHQIKEVFTGTANLLLICDQRQEERR